nr:MAG TPA: hypothetical protein [Caudoviricetes sp.]
MSYAIHFVDNILNFRFYLIIMTILVLSSYLAASQFICI